MKGNLCLKLLKTFDKSLVIISPILLIGSLFYHPLWFVFVLLNVWHYIINQKWKQLGLMIVIYTLFTIATIFLPGWIVILMGSILVFIVFNQVKKNFDTKKGIIISNEVMQKAQKHRAKFELMLMKTLIKAGVKHDETDIKYIEELKGRIKNNGRKQETEPVTINMEKHN